jgi:hypothetical protein
MCTILEFAGKIVINISVISNFAVPGGLAIKGCGRWIAGVAGSNPLVDIDLCVL